MGRRARQAPPEYEPRITFKEAAALANPPVKWQTVSDWTTNGIISPAGRVYLESVREGGRLFTTRQALARFRARINGAVLAQP